MSTPLRILTGVFAAAAAAVAAACSPSEQGVMDVQTGDPVIVLSEGPCFGTCPVYDMTLRPDGGYMLNSVRFVKQDGLSEGDIGSQAWAAATDILEDADFWTLKPVQTMETLQNCHTDAPTVMVTWRTEAGREKTVTYNAGCGVRKMNAMISNLRAALHFEDLVWTDDRFNPVTGER